MQIFGQHFATACTHILAKDGKQLLKRLMDIWSDREDSRWSQERERGSVRAWEVVDAAQSLVESGACCVAIQKNRNASNRIELSFFHFNSLDLIIRRLIKRICRVHLIDTLKGAKWGVLMRSVHTGQSQDATIRKRFMTIHIPQAEQSSSTKFQLSNKDLLYQRTRAATITFY